MAATDFAGASTRPHWGGAGSDVDQHLEVYQNEVDSKFQMSALMRALSAQRSTKDRSNNYRIDRLGASAVQGRQSGVKLNPTKVTSDKLNIVVDTVLYIRNPIDYQDDWTGPDYLREMGINNGTAFAEMFDQAHIIQLIKARGWVAPAHLKVNGAFYDGAEVTCNIKAAPASIADYEANAYAIEVAHKNAVNALVKRHVPITNLITLLSPDLTMALSHHPKLQNVQFNTAGGGAFEERRALRMNSVVCIESTSFPTGAITGHPLSNANNGNAFDCTATDALYQMVVFDRTMALVTVEALPFTTDFWNCREEFANVLDCYAMYIVGVRRPDYIVSIKIVAA